MKRIIAMLCVLAMLLSMPVYAAGTEPVISADAVTAEADATVQVPIRITRNPGILGARITVAYAEGLTLTKVTAGDAFSALTMTKPGDLKANPVSIVWDGQEISEEDIKDGVIATLTFKAPSKAGTYDIKLSAAAKEIVDGDLTPVSVKFQAGSVTVNCDKGHTEVIDPAVAATCTEAGKETRSCQREGCTAAEEHEIPATGHTEGPAVQENVVPATYEREGSYEEAVYSSVCGAELSRRTRVIPRLEREIYPTPPVNIPQVKPKFPFVDVPTSAWYYDSVKSAWENDLINGVTNSKFRPDENMTVAQAIKLSAALHQLNHRGRVSLKNGSPDWYSTYVDYAIENGLIESAYGKYTAAQMNSTVTRAEFVHIFHAAAKDLRVINAVADNTIPDVKTGAAFAAEIYDFYRAGILTGSDVKGTFRPSDSINRSEVAAILIRMFDSSARRTITLE